MQVLWKKLHSVRDNAVGNTRCGRCSFNRLHNFFPKLTDNFVIKKYLIEFYFNSLHGNLPVVHSATVNWEPLIN